MQQLKSNEKIKICGKVNSRLYIQNLNNNKREENL